jgi:hypothetical protein
VYAKAIVTAQWKQHEKALIDHGEMSPEEARTHCKAGLAARIAELRQNYVGSEAKMSTSATTTLPEGLHRDAPSLLHFFGGPNWTVDPHSPAADAIRKTEHFKDAEREGIAWSKAVSKADGTPPDYPQYMPDACDIFGLNAAANGWLIGEKLEASTDNYTPSVPADLKRTLERGGAKPLDVYSLSTAVASRTATPAAQPDATTRDLTAYTPVNEPAYGGRSL